MIKSVKRIDGELVEKTSATKIGAVSSILGGILLLLEGYTSAEWAGLFEAVPAAWPMISAGIVVIGGRNIWERYEAGQKG